MYDLGLGVFDEDGGEEEPQPDPVKQKKDRRWLRRSLLALSLVLALVVGVGAFYVVVGVNALQGLKREPGLMPTDNPETGAPVLNEGPVDFVLIGTDSRGSDRGRSDTLMIAHLNTERNALYLISFPRDLYVPIAGHGKNKINAAYSFGGAALTVKTVQNLTGTKMDHTAIIDFPGFVGLTSDVGGVTVFNQVASSNLGYDFPRGDITIKGEQALAYVRQRYGLPGGDFDRAERQRIVVRALILKLLKPSTMANPATFNAVATKLGANVTVDDQLTNQVIWNLATDTNISSSAQIRQLQAPIGRAARVHGSDVLFANETQMAELSEAIRTDQLGAYWNKYGED